MFTTWVFFLLSRLVSNFSCMDSQTKKKSYQSAFIILNYYWWTVLNIEFTVIAQVGWGCFLSVCSFYLRLSACLLRLNEHFCTWVIVVDCTGVFHGIRVNRILLWILTQCCCSGWKANRALSLSCWFDGKLVLIEWILCARVKRSNFSIQINWHRICWESDII